jgi:16S rRNA G966 N2-methylase RsmD
LGNLDADIVFLDPPYPKEGEYRAALEVLEAKPPALIVVQHSVRFPLEPEYGPLRLTRTLKQGDNALSFFS